MARGPLPPDAAASSNPGLMFWLNAAYKALPPRARIALAQQVKAWAEKAEGDARADMRPEPGPNDFAAHGAGVYDTTGQQR